MLLNRRTLAVAASVLLLSSMLSACIVVPARRYRVVVEANTPAPVTAVAEATAPTPSI